MHALDVSFKETTFLNEGNPKCQRGGVIIEKSEPYSYTVVHPFSSVFVARRPVLPWKVSWAISWPWAETLLRRRLLLMVSQCT